RAHGLARPASPEWPTPAAILGKELPFRHSPTEEALILCAQQGLGARPTMKKILSVAAAFMGLATAASAADFPVMPAKAPLPVPVIFSWTGCYIGVEGGGQRGKSEQIAQSGVNSGQTITGSFDLSGGIAGGTVGCNVQMSNFVIGVENDFSWTNKNGSVH